ncbi:exopolysaccharide biosynthesis protein [Rhodoferax sp.]|jgi:hypothetical protein|uniref:exopolysaccharide biosynthesis protein n=1 Tax=Rhodoferax sp. TaxID=50421 RepID=UPI003783161E
MQFKPPNADQPKRTSTTDRIARVYLNALGDTVADTVGHSNRERLVWLGLLATPLLFPVALPGMASAVGLLCVVVSVGVCLGHPIDLPAWLGQRALHPRAKSLLTSASRKALHLVGRFARPRLLRLSDRPMRLVNGLVLATAGLSMAVPVPMITFDNVLPALGIVLMAWGLRLRDGLMVLAAYLATLAAVASIVLFWWGGTVLVGALIAWVTR